MRLEEFEWRARCDGLSLSKVLDIGCGRHKLPGSIGLDIVPLEGVDVVHDLNQFPYPFSDNSFDSVRLSHAHLDITIVEGKNRQIRRMIESLDGRVLKLVRRRIGNLSLGNLQIGRYRFLSKDDLALLRQQPTE